jgi:hypothetical protein
MRTDKRRQIAQGSLLLGFALTLAASGYSQTRAENTSTRRFRYIVTSPSGPIATTSSSFKDP